MLYITHIDNLISILKEGILCHSLVDKKNLQCKTIYNQDVVNRRKNILVDGERSLWNFANLYFNPRNPMLYSLVKRPGFASIEYVKQYVIIAVKPSILQNNDVYVSDGNSAHSLTEFYPISGRTKEDSKRIFQIAEKINTIEWWDETKGTKREVMAECLVPEKIPPSYFQTLHVPNQDAAQHVEKLQQENGIHPILPASPTPSKFFRPTEIIPVNPSSKDNLFLAKGDMFFTERQTLTISVNCVGVMGKGLASKSKYRFPDVYVEYQDLCKKKKLALGRPYLYRRGTSVFDEMKDTSFNINDSSNSGTCFLLFPTKYHWREKSRIDKIEKGLQWLVSNYKKVGIESLAIPALGCGLGGLKWQEVGPTMCKYLASMNINTTIYLPTNKKIDSKYLSPKFLLP
jgi:O-acetyl-ADP-ribose deacetylase (regulator of RNase III)